jgi:citrate lyase subunit beta/citryl-CoA lyase
LGTPADPLIPPHRRGCALESGGDLARARGVVAAWDAAGGGVAVDERGRMVDEAVVRLARRTAETADRLGL